jgi:hypothetical protein
MITIRKNSPPARPAAEDSAPSGPFDKKALHLLIDAELAKCHADILAKVAAMLAPKISKSCDNAADDGEPPPEPPEWVLARGISVTEAIAIVGGSRSFIYKWKNRVRTDGIIWWQARKRGEIFIDPNTLRPKRSDGV